MEWHIRTVLSTSGLSRHPFTVESRVRIPLGRHSITRQNLHFCSVYGKVFMLYSIHKKKVLNVADGKLRHTPLFRKVCEDVNK